MQKHKTLLIIAMAVLCGQNALGDTPNFICNELLGRPTANSITIHAVAAQALEVFYEYGTDSLNYSSQTNVQTSVAGVPFVFELSELKPDTKYFYRLKYRIPGTQDYTPRPAHGFRTQRPRGSTYSFAIEADPHLDTNSIPDSFTLTLQNILSKNPDFMIDLGDTFMSEKLAVKTQDSITMRHLLLRSYFDKICHSVPLYLVLGNHEGELGWLLNNTATSLPVLTTNTRKLYYPNPEPNAFYTGNTKSENFVGLRQNYYAWEWGDALFVVLDPFWHTTKKADWSWTLGVDQYNWFKNTLSASTAKFKFVFCHNLVGGYGTDMRGGTEFAHLFEWGGMNLDSTWGFDVNRPGWGKPIHQLMVENGVTIFFHGHDHFYGKQEKDGIIYQEVPQPSNKNIQNTSAAKYGYTSGLILPGRGYLSVTVTDTTTKVEYVKTLLPAEAKGQNRNGDIADSYTIIKPKVSPVIECTKGEGMQLMINPNPATASTIISAFLHEYQPVSIRIFDMTGRLVRSFDEQMPEGGKLSIDWDCKTDNGTELGSGVYMCCLIGKYDTKTVEFTIVK